MGTTTAVKSWDFGTAGHYTLADDATITDGVLSMTDPIFRCYWGTKYWSGNLEYDGNGDTLLAVGTQHYAMDGESDPTALSLADGLFYFWVKVNGDLSAADVLHHLIRYDTLQNIKVRTIFYPSGAAVHGRVVDHDDAIRAEDTKTGQDFGVGEWREVFIRFIGDEVRLQIGALRSVEFRSITRTTEGAVGFRLDGANRRWTLGGGDGGSQPEPRIAYRRTGTCELKEANAWLIPKGCASLGRLGLVADFDGSGDVPLPIKSQYRLKHDGSWGDWTAVPADGDMSGLTFDAGTDYLLWRINDGSGLGMDNQLDPRYVPSVYRVVLTHEQDAPTWVEDGELKDILVNLESLLNADGTLQGYHGWSGAYAVVPEVGEFPIHHQCGVLITPENTDEDFIGSSLSDGNQIQRHCDDHHHIAVVPCVRIEGDAREHLVGDAGLLDFAEDVLQVLRGATLDSTVWDSVVTGIDIMSLQVPGYDDGELGSLIGVKISMDVWVLPHTHTRG